MFVDLDDDRYVRVDFPSKDEVPDSLELTPLLLLLPLLRSAIDEGDSNSSPNISGVSGLSLTSEIESLLATAESPANQLGKLLLSVSRRS